MANPFYSNALSRFLALPTSHWSIPSVCVGSWVGRSEVPKEMSPSPYVPHGQSTVMWKAFWRSSLPPFLKDFIYQVLWAKLKVGERLQKWTKSGR